jgi:predicted transcriptional regulator
MEGWISLYRKFLEWEWYSDINTKTLFIHLLLKANHKSSKWQGIEIKRGQLVTGRKVLARETGLSEQQVRTSLEKLKSTNETTIKSTKQNSVITILKYEVYQNTQQNSQPTSYEKNNIDYDLITDNALRKIDTFRPTNESTKHNSIIDSTTEIYQPTNQPTTNQRPTTNNNVINIYNHVPFEEIKNSFNEICSELPRIKSITPKRKTKVATRWKEQPDINYWVEIFKKVQDSDFLSGRSSNKWKCSFDWIFENGSNYIKIDEGNYSNKAGGKKDESEYRLPK